MARTETPTLLTDLGSSRARGALPPSIGTKLALGCRALVSFAMVALLSTPGEAVDLDCPLVQLTNSAAGIFTGAGSSSFSGDGRWITFGADGLEPGDGFEIYAWDLEQESLSRLTHSPSYNGNPATSWDGTWVAFESENDWGGQNPDGSREIVVLDRSTGSVTVESDLTELNFSPGLSWDGRWLSFLSDEDPLGTNADGGRELFVKDLWSGELLQVSANTGGILWGSAINRSGTHAVYGSTEDSVGENPEGNEEIFLVDLATGVRRQLTHTGTGSWNTGPTLSDDARWVAFVAAGEITGGQVHVVAYDVLEDTFHLLAPILPVFSYSVVISPDGSRVGSSLGDRIGLHEVPEGGEQVLLEPDGSINDGVAVSFDGTIAAFRSNSNPLGSNGDHNFELFMSRCPALVFADGFEGGSTGGWSAAVP